MTEKILIIEDIESDSSFLKEPLQNQYDIVMIESTEEGLALLKESGNGIKLILINLSSSNISFRDFLEKKHEMADACNIPVIVVSANISEGEQISGLKLGVNEYVDRTILPEILSLRVNSLIEQSREMSQVKSEVQNLKSKLGFDEMTGALSKKKTESSMNRYLEGNEGTLDAMLIIDIDHFKMVNDTLGHQAGDKIIQIVVKIITELLRKSDLVGRVGGDEFCVLMKDVPNMDIVYTKVRRLCQIMKYKPNLEIPDYVTLSIGISQNHREKTTYEAMFQEADEALYNAKNGGRARYCEYGITLQEIEEEQENSNSQGNNKDTILIVDDDPIARQITGKLLGKQYQIIEAENGLEAMRLISENRVVTIILDLIMPIMDGYQFMKSIKRNDLIQPIPVIVMTASTIPEDDLRILSLGADVVLHKPINKDMLVQYVNNQVEGYKHHIKEVQEYNAHKAMMVNGTKAFLCTYQFEKNTVEIGHEYLRYFNEDFPSYFSTYPFDLEHFVLGIQIEQARKFFDVKEHREDTEKIELRLKTTGSVYKWFEISKLTNSNFP